MTWTIEYPYEDVEQFILKLPVGLSAKYFHLADIMLEFGANLGMPHTKSMSNGLFELRVKGKEGIAWAVLLHQGRQANHCVAWVREEDREDTLQ